MKKNRLALYVAMLLAGFLFMQAPAYAQTGSLMVYGSVNYQNNTQGKHFSTNPIGVGYFFNNHIVAGVNYGSDWQKDTNHNLIQNRHEAGVFYSDSWALGKHFVFIAQLDLHGTWGEQQLGDPTGPSSYHGYLARLYPIAVVNLGHGWALKAKFAELSYERILPKNHDLASGHNFVSGVNGSTLGMGVSKNIALFKRHKHK